MIEWSFFFFFSSRKLYSQYLENYTVNNSGGNNLAVIFISGWRLRYIFVAIVIREAFVVWIFALRLNVAYITRYNRVILFGDLFGLISKRSQHQWKASIVYRYIHVLTEHTTVHVVNGGRLSTNYFRRLNLRWCHVITDYSVELLLPTIALDFIWSNELGVRIYAATCSTRWNVNQKLLERNRISMKKNRFLDKIPFFSPWIRTFFFLQSWNMFYSFVGGMGKHVGEFNFLSI